MKDRAKCLDDTVMLKRNECKVFLILFLIVIDIFIEREVVNTNKGNLTIASLSSHQPSFHFALCNHQWGLVS